MIAKLLELLTGRDDLERVASREDLTSLNSYLKTRRLWVPRRPRRFLDAASFTPEELLELMREEAEELAGDTFEPWILEMEGKMRLPAFSNQKRMVVFSGEISKRMGKVFSLGCVDLLIEDIVKDERVNIDFVDLNPMSRKSWEIGIGELRHRD